MQLFDVYPLLDITIEKAQGSTVWDHNGTPYLDFYGGHAVISVGHTHPHYVQRLHDQLGKIGFYSNAVKMPIQQQLAEKLCTVSGKKDYHLFLCNSGAEANENALKLASFHTGRKKIIAFEKAFHGRTSLAVAVTDNPAIQAPVNQNPDVIFLPFNNMQALEKCFMQWGSSIAAVITEGIQGVAGIHEATPAFLQTIRRLCDQYNSVFIADSVQCGYGRSGKFFSHDHAGVNADIYTMAKGMGNGFPVAGILIAPHIKAKYGLLGTTFGGNPLACAAAMAVLEIMEQEQLMKQAEKTGNYLIKALKKLPKVKEVRGKGLIIGIELPESLKHVRMQLLSEHKIFTGEAKPNVIRLLPALNITQAEADQFIAALTAALKN
jgi:acetylornithine aminotransferase